MAWDDENLRQNRARYPDKDEPVMIPRTYEDDVDYPDMVYSAEEPKEPDETPDMDEPDLIYPDPVYDPPETSRQSSGFWKFLCFLCLALLIAGGIYVYSLYRDYGPFRQRVSVARLDTFAQGVTVDRIPIGGMTRAQAEAALTGQAVKEEGSLRLTILVDGQECVITSKELPLE